MLCRADSIGVFQVESRAQVGTLPRLQPRRFYDLVVEIALIRPGPIQGGAVHPYIRRATGREQVTYLHPALEPVLERTMGVPLFQEQLMQIADGGRRLHRRRRRPAAPGDGLQARGGEDRAAAGEAVRGDGAHGITGELADDIYARIQAFANFGFAESHAISFALLVYAALVAEAALPGRVPGRRCCGRSRWGSTPRSPWWPTPAGTACGCCGRTSRCPGWTPSSRLSGVGGHRAHPATSRHGSCLDEPTTEGRARSIAVRRTRRGAPAGRGTSRSGWG